MPYRIDIPSPPDDILERLRSVDVLDVEASNETLSALIGDSTPPDAIRALLSPLVLQVSPARGRDDDSVWVLHLREHAVGRWRFSPVRAPVDDRTIALGDGQSFGTGFHPTTSLCLEMLDEFLEAEIPHSMLDVGTGSGILALAALNAGVPSVAALDIELEALKETRRSAHANGLQRGLSLVQGGPAALGSSWPLVFANILPAVLIDIAPALAPRVAHRGRLVLSGIPDALSRDVERAYVRCGMRRGWQADKAGWSALVLTPTW